MGDAMNALVPFKQLSMTSFEIAELVESRHDKVRQSIERLANRGVITLPPLGEKPTAGRPAHFYTFTGDGGKRDSIIVVAQLSPEFTARLVDRWQELEAAQTPSLPDFTNPAEAARAWAEQYDQKQEALQQLEAATPKIRHYDAVVERKTLLNATQVGQKLGLSAMRLNRLLDDYGVYSKSIKRGRAFRQWFVDNGKGIMRQTESGHSQPMFTPRGEAWVIERLIADGITAPYGGDYDVF